MQDSWDFIVRCMFSRHLGFPITLTGNYILTKFCCAACSKNCCADSSSCVSETTIVMSEEP